MRRLQGLISILRCFYVASSADTTRLNLYRIPSGSPICPTPAVSQAAQPRSCNAYSLSFCILVYPRDSRGVLLRGVWFLKQDVLDLQSQMIILTESLQPAEKKEKIQSLLDSRAQSGEDLRTVRILISYHVDIFSKSYLF